MLQHATEPGAVKVAVITTRVTNGTAGGAERFYDALVRAFRSAGHATSELAVSADEPDFDTIKRNYLACYDLDVTRFDLVVSTKAPTWLVRHPRHVCYLVHTIRVFYDMFDATFPGASRELKQQQQLVHHLDTAALSPPRCKAVFAIGHEVSRRLRKWNGLDVDVLHPPLWSDRFHPGSTGDYLLMPGRLHPWKRVELAIRAMQYVKSDVRLVVVGTGEAASELRALAADNPRIEFRGSATDAELVDLYAGAFAVPFVPLREDYGYVTLEAFASGKPVLTCTDSGEAAAIVTTTDGGIVSPPDPVAIASAIDQLRADPASADAMGQRGHAWVTGLSWSRIVERLISPSTTIGSGG